MVSESRRLNYREDCVAECGTLPERCCLAELSSIFLEQKHDEQLPLVTVVIPTFNSVTYLRDTFLSVVNQRYRPIEVIIVDDGSTDGTRDLIAKLQGEHDKKDFQVRILFNQRRGRIFPECGDQACKWRFYPISRS